MGTITITCDVADLKEFLAEREDSLQVGISAMRDADTQLARVQELESELHSVRDLLWRAQQEAVNTVRARVAPEDMQELLKANQNKDRLKTIRWVRQLTGLPLKESMVLVDEIIGYRGKPLFVPENETIKPCPVAAPPPMDEIGGSPVKYDGGDIKDDPVYSDCPDPSPVEDKPSKDKDDDIPF